MKKIKTRKAGKYRFIMWALVVAGISAAICLSYIEGTRNLREFAEQHKMIKGTWVLEDVEGARDDFYILHAFDYGKTYTGGSDDKSGKGLGDYEINEVNDDGSFELTIKNDWYGYTSEMDITPIDDAGKIKIYTQTFKKISDVYQERR